MSPDSRSWDEIYKAAATLDAMGIGKGSGWSTTKMTTVRLTEEEDLPDSQPESIPDAIDPIIGYRWFNVDTEGIYAGLLQSLHYSMTWEPGKAEVARCRASSAPAMVLHPAPEEKCRCGIYALTDKTQLVLNYNQASAWGRFAVLGTVKLWGKVIPATKGVRAQYALPTKLEIRMPVVPAAYHQRTWTADEAIAYLSAAYPDCEVSVISERGIDDLVLDRLRGEVAKVAERLSGEGITVEQAMDALKRSLDMVGLGGHPAVAPAPLPSAHHATHVSLHTGAPTTPLPFTPAQDYRRGPTTQQAAPIYRVEQAFRVDWPVSRTRRFFRGVHEALAIFFGPWWVLLSVGLMNCLVVVLAFLDIEAFEWDWSTWVHLVLAPLNLASGVKRYREQHR